MSEHTFVATCAMGLESEVSRELKRMGADRVTAEDRRVFFAGSMSVMARANLCLRTAERVLLVAGRFPAATFDELFEGTRALSWEELFAAADAFPVKGHSLQSKLASVPSCQSIIKKAVATRLESVYHIRQFEETGPVKQLQFFLRKDEVTLMLDTSGTGLHKRGYRPEAHEAPIRETLAAGMLSLSQVFRQPHLDDPMCGSGTLLIEGALMAAGIAPGLRRRFAAEGYGTAFTAAAGVPDVFAAERERAEGQRRETAFAARGWDIDPDAVRQTLDNARRAGVSELVSAQVGDVRQYEPPEQGLLVTNPPYGERLLDIRQAEELYGIMGRRFRLPNLGVISPHKEFERLFGRRAAKRRKLYNGTLECQYYMYY